MTCFSYTPWLPLAAMNDIAVGLGLLHGVKDFIFDSKCRKLVVALQYARGRIFKNINQKSICTLSSL